jgi:molybdate transport system substrate-binding protein
MTAGLSRGVAAILVVVALLAGCGADPTRPATTGPSSSGSSTAARPLTILGAASLKSALDRIKVAWESANPGSTLTISTDSSAALETQIEQGAPADVFLSADTTNPKKLVDAALADGPSLAFAANVLTIVVPAGNPGRVTSPGDLARNGVKVIAAGDHVPISKYARQVVANLTKATAGFDAAYAANVVSKEDNVKAVIAKIELGEGDAGIVYATDAKASSNVETIAIPADANVPATYAGVVVKGATHATEARAFLSWLAGPDGQAILATFGFLPPPD